MKTPPSNLDTQIGQSLKRTRLESGVTTQEIAKLLHISFQQIQKYEKGQNKIPSSSLFLVSKFLDVQINSFFKNINEEPYQMKEELEEFKEFKNASDREITNLVNHYSKNTGSGDKKKNPQPYYHFTI